MYCQCIDKRGKHRVSVGLMALSSGVLRLEALGAAQVTNLDIEGPIR